MASKRPVVSMKKTAASKEIIIESLDVPALLIPSPKLSKGKALARLEPVGTFGCTAAVEKQKQLKLILERRKKVRKLRAPEESHSAKQSARRRSLRSFEDPEPGE
jgi:hypothetical protein